MSSRESGEPSTDGSSNFLPIKNKKTYYNCEPCVQPWLRKGLNKILCALYTNIFYEHVKHSNILDMKGFLPHEGKHTEFRGG